MCLNVTDVIFKHLRRIPVKRHSSEWTNIYISCLFTLKSHIEDAAVIAKDQKLHDPKQIDELVRSLKLKKPILFHLDESKFNYVQTLVNEIIHALSVELSYSIASKVTVSACLRNMVTAANNAEEE